MPTTYIWAGGGDNLASDAADWSPSGLPGAGDSAVINSGTINVAGNVLGSDTLTATPGSTVNLSGGAAIDLLTNLGPAAKGGVVTINLNGGSARVVEGIYAELRVNATSGTLGTYLYNTDLAVEIAPGGTLTTLNNGVGHGGDLVISGGAGSVLDVEGSLADWWAGLIIATGSVVGSGKISVLGSVEINAPVAASVIVEQDDAGSGPNIGAATTLDMPLQFQGAIVNAETTSPGGEVLLKGLQATSYSYDGGVVTLYVGDGVEDTLRVQTAQGLLVQQGAAGVELWTGGKSGDAAAAALPVHQAPPAPPSNGPPPPTTGGDTIGSGSPPSAGGGADTPAAPGGSSTAPPSTGVAGAVGTNPSVTTPSATTPSGGTAAAPSSGGSGGANFDIVDMTTGQHSTAGGSAFTTATTDSLGITAKAPSVFIQSGTGNDIIQATAGGNNVLADTGGTVNFEIGGSGTDTFFLDARNSPVTWNTIAGLHSGDTAIIYGVSSQDLAANALPSAGVTGYQGLTLRTFQNGGASFLTLAGQSSLSGIASAFGKAPDGSSFLLLHLT